MRKLFLLISIVFNFSVVYSVAQVTPPVPPSDFNAVQIEGHESIAVSWTHPSPKPNKYRVYWKEAGSTQTDSTDIDTNHSSFTIDGLVFGKKYQVWMISLKNDTSTFTQIPSTPTSTKTVEVKGLVAPSITLSDSQTPWSSITLKITDPNTIESGFEISIKPAGESEKIQTLNKTGSNITENLDSLESDTWYTIKVRAVKDGTKGPWSNVVEHKTKIDLPPAAVLSQHGNCPNNVNISWEISSKFDIVESMSLLKSTNNSNFSEVLNNLAKSGTYNDSEAEAGTTIYYVLNTKNSSGETESNTLEVKVPAYQAPHPIQNLHLTEKTIKSLSVAWEIDATEEACDINKLDLIEIAYKINGGELSTPTQFGKTTSNFKVENLGLKHEVEFFIRTVSDKGLKSNWVTLKEKTYGVPNIPQNFSASPQLNPLGEPVIKVTWQDNSDDEDYFEILKSTDGVNFKQFAVLKYNYTQLIDTKINEGETYYYKIGAHNWVSEQLNIWNYTESIGPIVPGFSKAPTTPYGLKINLNGAGIDITWVDDSNREQNYIVERSLDGIGFITIASINRNETSYRDENIEEYRTYFYRIKATNSVGSSPPSNVEYLTVIDPGSLANFDINLFPNPTVEGVSIKGININSFKKYTLNIFDQNNQTILQKELLLNDENIESLDLSSLKSGVYYFTISDHHNMVSKKLVKL